MIVLMLLLISVASTCKLKAKVNAETYHPVWAQFSFHNGTKSKVYKFTDSIQNHTLYIEGPICNLKPTILKSYKQHPKPGVKPIGQTMAFLEGQGIVAYTVIRLERPGQVWDVWTMSREVQNVHKQSGAPPTMGVACIGMKGSNDKSFEFGFKIAEGQEKVYHDEPPRMGARMAVSCGFGDCGSRG